ncbi:ribonuclease R [Desulfoplanes sp.]
MARRKKKPNRPEAKISPKSILDLFNEANRPLPVKEILTAFAPDKSEKKKIKSILNSLVDQGKLLRSGRQLALVGKLPLTKGVLEVQRSGVGFVIPEDKRRKDIFVSPDNFDEAWPNDTVLVAVLPGRRGKNQEGRIVRVLERALSVLPCLVLKRVGPASFVCRPADPKIPLLFTADCGSLTSHPQTNDIILVSPDERVDKSMWMGTATAILGGEGDLSVQENLVKIGHSIPGPFPRSVINQASELPDRPSPDDFKNRRDLRGLPLVTIDGARARDFDDAIHVARTDKGFCLHVAIADVSHYVYPGSPLDREALERGNSYYFPLSVEPMLPEALSNGLCSLNPDEPRLAMVAEIEFSSQGTPRKSSFYSAVIKSHARLTYSQVNEALFLDNGQVRHDLKRTLPMLETAETLARKLLANRHQRGSIDFDLPESEIIQDPGELAIQVIPRTRHFGHQMIEEFMLAANEAVAEYLTERQVPVLYRVHPEPDQTKLDALMKLLARTDLGEHLPKGRSPKELQELLSTAARSDMEFLVNRLLLRSMMKAGYSPINQGHFGLASGCYCHFTSPIRRYADINVHRVLKTCLGAGETKLPGKKSLTNIGESINACERKAMQAEREILKRATILHLREHIGEVFEGVVSGLADFGFWVELEDILAEGLVRLSSLGDDYYAFLNREQIILGQRTGKTYKLGQRIRVRVENASLGRLEIDLGVVGEK